MKYIRVIKFRFVNIIGSVQLNSPSATESDIQKAIKIWLKHAPERLKDSVKRQNR